MIKVFIEFKLDPAKRDGFFRLAAQAGALLAAKGASEYRIFEGVDQPNLMVEEFQVADIGDYRLLKEDRLDERHELWREMNACAAGGREKINIWAFQEA